MFQVALQVCRTESHLQHLFCTYLLEHPFYLQFAISQHFINDMCCTTEDVYAHRNMVQGHMSVILHQPFSTMPHCYLFLRLVACHCAAHQSWHNIHFYNLCTILTHSIGAASMSKVPWVHYFTRVSKAASLELKHTISSKKKSLRCCRLYGRWCWQQLGMHRAFTFLSSGPWDTCKNRSLFHSTVALEGSCLDEMSWHSHSQCPNPYIPCHNTILGAFFWDILSIHHIAQTLLLRENTSIWWRDASHDAPVCVKHSPGFFCTGIEQVVYNWDKYFTCFSNYVQKESVCPLLFCWTFMLK